MFDFPENAEIARLLKAMLAEQKLVLAVCHGPAALLALQHATDDSAAANWLQGKQLTAFTNAEELVLMPDAARRFNGLLQDKLQQRGAIFVEGPRYLPHLVQDGQLLTAQNPWSVWMLAQATVQALGVEPRPRTPSAEERTMQLLFTLHHQGLAGATQQIPVLLEQGPLQRNLVLTMALVAGMAEEWSNMLLLLRLTQQLKSQQQLQPNAAFQGIG